LTGSETKSKRKVGIGRQPDGQLGKITKTTLVEKKNKRGWKLENPGCTCWGNGGQGRGSRDEKTYAKGGGRKAPPPGRFVGRR